MRIIVLIIRSHVQGYTDLPRTAKVSFRVRDVFSDPGLSIWVGFTLPTKSSNCGVLGWGFCDGLSA